MAAAGTALLHAPKSVRDDAQSLARKSATKARQALQTAAKVETPVAATIAGTALGLMEGLAGVDTDVIGVDNGVALGLPLAVGGAMFKGAFGKFMMLAGAGLLASGARTMARELSAGAGAAGATTEGIG